MIVSTRSYCLGLLATPCQIELVDPPSNPRKPVNLKITLDDFARGYYQPFLEFLSTDTRKLTSGGRTAFVRPITFDPIDGTFVYVGLENEHYFAAKRDAPVPFVVPEFEDATLFIASDGVAIAMSAGPCDFL